MLENLKEDWRTYEGDIWRQGLWVMWVYRFGRWRYRVRPAWARKPLSLLYKILRTLNQMSTGIELPCETRVGRRLRIEHFGGIIVSGDALVARFNGTFYFPDHEGMWKGRPPPAGPLLGLQE